MKPREPELEDEDTRMSGRVDLHSDAFCFYLSHSISTVNHFSCWLQNVNEILKSVHVWGDLQLEEHETREETYGGPESSTQQTSYSIVLHIHTT